MFRLYDIIMNKGIKEIFMSIAQIGSALHLSGISLMDAEKQRQTKVRSNRQVGKKMQKREHNFSNK